MPPRCEYENCERYAVGRYYDKNDVPGPLLCMDHALEMSHGEEFSLGDNPYTERKDARDDGNDAA